MVIIKCGQKQRVLKVSYHMCTKLLDKFLAVRFECTQLTQDNRMFFFKSNTMHFYMEHLLLKKRKEVVIFLAVSRNV